MRAKKKTRPCGDAQKRARAEAQDQAVQGFHRNHSIGGAGGQATIAALLSYGQENAIPMSNLQAVTGLDRRTIRAMIQRERLDCARSMKHRAGEIMKVAQAIEGAT